MSDDKLVMFPTRSTAVESRIISGTKQDESVGRILCCNCGCNSFCISESGFVYCWNCKVQQVGEKTLHVDGMMRG